MANNVSIKGGSLQAQIMDAFDVTEAVVNQAAEDCSYKAAQKTKELLKGAPVNGTRYNSGWKIKKGKTEATVYQASQPGLTHLLENGHDIVINGQKVGHARAIPHIKPAEEIGKEYFEELIVEEIERRLKG